MKVRWIPLLLLSVWLAGCAYHARVREAEAFAAQGDFHNALAAYQEAAAQQSKPRGNDLALRMAAVRQAWGADLMKDAHEAAAAGHPGTAAYLAMRATELAPEQHAAAEALQSAAREQSRVTVLATPRTPSSAPALETFRAELRDEPRVALLSMPGATSPTLAVRFFITTPTTALETTLKTNRVDYVTGQQTVPNPEYAAQQARITLARERVRKARENARREEEDMIYLLRVSSRDLSDQQRGQMRMRYDDARNAAHREESTLAGEEQRLKQLAPTVQQPILKPYEFTAQQHVQRSAAFLGGTLSTPEGSRPIEQPLELVNNYEEYPAQAEPKLPAMVPVIATEQDIQSVLQQQAGGYLAGLIKGQIAGWADRLQTQAEDTDAPTETRLEAAGQLLNYHGPAVKPEDRDALQGLAALLAELPEDFTKIARSSR